MTIQNLEWVKRLKIREIFTIDWQKSKVGELDQPLNFFKLMKGKILMPNNLFNFKGRLSSSKKLETTGIICVFRFNIFEGVNKVVDLCAAPGSWSQVLSRKLKEKDGAKIVAVDLQPMSPIEGIVNSLFDIATLRLNPPKILVQSVQI